jgi:anhydro-N-acetylmuramic acid kinase
MLVIGLMSGTSADAIDAAVVEWPDDGAARPFRLRAYVEVALGAELQSRVHALAAGELEATAVLRELARLDVELGERFAAAAREAARVAGIALDRVDAISSHGQTVAHHPEHSASLQIGNPSVIAERTGCTVLADFRPRDLAAGGEGAPLAPFFHHAVFSEAGEPRAVLNLGGIANLTWLPPSAAAGEVVAFDVGPAGALADAVVQLATQGSERFDRDGARAARGTVDDALLARLLDDEFLERPPPKSTGRERYGKAQADALLRDSGGYGGGEGRALDNLLATLLRFTVESIARACGQHLPGRPRRWLLGGGGARKPVLMAALDAALSGVAVEPMEAAGVPADAAEAMAFSLMGRNALLGLPNHLPRTTGARRAAPLGQLVPGALGWRPRAER